MKTITFILAILLAGCANRAAFTADDCARLVTLAALATEIITDIATDEEDKKAEIAHYATLVEAGLKIGCVSIPPVPEEE